MPSKVIKENISMVFEKLKSRGRLLRKRKFVTKILGYQFDFNLNRIEIDITYDCELKCLNCNRACNLFPSKEAISINQINKFIKESIRLDKKWEIIRVAGGEPTLHPDFAEIVDALVSYKESFSPETTLQVVTSNFGSKVDSVLSLLPKSFQVSSSNKESVIQEFRSFTLAPLDSKEYLDTEYRNGCGTIWFDGIALTPYGYYPCGPGAAVDRIFGFDIGEKELPADINVLREKMQILCKFCGSFKINRKKKTATQEFSKSWKEACKNYNLKKPSLSCY
jgi:hypothetical protein